MALLHMRRLFCVNSMHFSFFLENDLASRLNSLHSHQHSCSVSLTFAPFPSLASRALECQNVTGTAVTLPGLASLLIPASLDLITGIVCKVPCVFRLWSGVELDQVKLQSFH